MNRERERGCDITWNEYERKKERVIERDHKGKKERESEQRESERGCDITWNERTLVYA